MKETSKIIIQVESDFHKMVKNESIRKRYDFERVNHKSN